MTDIYKAAQQVLEIFDIGIVREEQVRRVENLRAALEQPAEPVAWEWRWFDESPYTVTSGQWSEWKRVEPRSALQTAEDAVNEYKAYITDGYRYELRALYTAPQPAAWVGLTDEEIAELFEDGLGYEHSTVIARAIEAKLREKNGFKDDK